MFFARHFGYFRPVVIAIVATIFKKHIIAILYSVGITVRKLHSLRYYPAETGEVLHLYTQFSAATGSLRSAAKRLKFCTGTS